MTNNLIELFKELRKNNPLKERFKREPKAVLKEYHVEISDPRTIQVVEDTANKKHIVIHHPTAKEDLEKSPLPENIKRFLGDLIRSPQMKAQLKKNPMAVLKNYGMEFPEETQFDILEDSETLTYWVIPYPQEITDAQLQQISAGGTGTGIAGFGAALLTVANAPLGIAAIVLTMVFSDKIDAFYDKLKKK